MSVETSVHDVVDGRATPRRSPAQWLAMGSVFLVPVSLGAAAMAQTSLMLVGGVAIVFSFLAFAGARLDNLHGKTIVALCLVGQAICLTAALTGHSWQIDSHMMFFAVLAVCMVLAEPMVILVAAAAIAVHHLSLSAIQVVQLTTSTAPSPRFQHWSAQSKRQQTTSLSVSRKPIRQWCNWKV